MELVAAILGSSALASLISGLLARHDRKKQKNDGIMLLLYHDIKVECRDYIQRGSIESDELEVLIKMHDAYHNMGGNGYLDKLMSEVKNLPIVG